MKKIIILFVCIFLVGCKVVPINYDDVYYSRPYSPNFYPYQYSPLIFERYAPWNPYYQPRIYVQPRVIEQPRIIYPIRPSTPQKNNGNAPIRKFDKNN